MYSNTKRYCSCSFLFSNSLATYAGPLYLRLFFTITFTFSLEMIGLKSEEGMPFPQCYFLWKTGNVIWRNVLDFNKNFHKYFRNQKRQWLWNSKQWYHEENLTILHNITWCACVFRVCVGVFHGPVLNFCKLFCELHVGHMTKMVRLRFNFVWIYLILVKSLRWNKNASIGI